MNEKIYGKDLEIKKKMIDKSIGYLIRLKLINLQSGILNDKKIKSITKKYYWYYLVFLWNKNKKSKEFSIFGNTKFSFKKAEEILKDYIIENYPKDIIKCIKKDKLERIKREHIHNYINEKIVRHLKNVNPKKFPYAFGNTNTNTISKPTKIIYKNKVDFTELDNEIKELEKNISEPKIKLVNKDVQLGNSENVEVKLT